ncbi:MAG: FtsX-like permease family protein, partial [Gammaproteobacteria bacterium]|nr:FtsX-like permease family protein [Gammaproteobacteria bacterium]
MKYLFLVWSNLKRKKLRTILTLLSLVVAFLLFGYLAAIKQAFTQGVEVAGVDRLIVRHKISLIQLLPETYESRIENVEGVENAMHQTWFGGYYQRPTNFFAQIPVVPEELYDLYPEILVDEDVMQRWSETRDGVLVGTITADRFGWQVGDRIPIISSIWQNKEDGQTWIFEMIGTYEGETRATDSSQVFIRYDYFQEARAFGDGLVGWYVVRVEEPERAAEVAAAIDEEFANSPNETKAEPEGAFLQGFANQGGDIATIITAIVTAVFFTILLVAGNTMAYAVRERTNELAALKAIGFTDRSVLMLVLAESLVLVGLGGAIGLSLAVALVSMGDPTGGSLPIFFISLGDILTGVVLIGLMALAAGILPALQAQRLRIADALR